MSEKRNWLIVRFPNWPTTVGLTDNLVVHAEFAQEQLPGISGGTGARKLLTRTEAYEACERLAKNHKHILNGDVYAPVEIGPIHRSNVRTEYDYLVEE